MQQYNLQEFQQFLRKHWRQGQHIVILGPTGSGKTLLAAKFLGIRQYVVVLAVKTYDDSIKQFQRVHYRVIKTWPPEYNQHKVVLWEKPTSLTALKLQSIRLSEALELMYLAGGWCIYFDEAGYIAGHLKLAKELGTLLNQGRSSGLSIVSAMTRPHSVVGQVPLETLNQVSFAIIFRYMDDREIASCAQIAGISKQEMIEAMEQLNEHDFLLFAKNQRKNLLVRQS